ncbi:helix-turn-helix domain-containing protein [Nocardioides alkalitolerans]|uniref:helix-turn-helix domain-containing protein n=1 Tax=Nocardioides alkalitolerans TaxID=281714 RepID=UPI00041E9447|nr:helix-turn-helix domain-containing protein [Nocardioides alkalitolerans]
MLHEFAPETSVHARDADEWRTTLREHFVRLDVEKGARDLRGAVESRMLGHVQMSTVASVDQDVIRPPHLLRDGESLLQVAVMRSGRALVEQDSRSAELGPGDFVVYETSRPFEWRLRSPARSPHWELSVFTWKRSAFRLGEARSRDVTARAFKGNEGMGRVMSEMLCGLLTESSSLALGQAAAVADHVGELVAVAAEALPAMPMRSAPESLLHQVDAYIDEHLADPDLNPDQVAAAVAISTRQLHRHFASRDRTVAQTIRTRRLEGARREIRSSLARDRSLREIARNWGFVDLDVFGRLFRQEFGMSPREYRQMLCRASDDPRAVVRPRR